MADMFDALEKQSAMASARAGVKMPKQNPRMLAIAAKQEFKIADFSNSGRIDDDEALEVLQKVAANGGFPVPPADRCKALIAHCCSRTHSFTSDEFVLFIQMAATGEEIPQKEEAATPAPAAPPPAVQVPISPPTPGATEVLATPTQPKAPAAPPPSAGAAASSATTVAAGNLKVAVLEAEGLPPRSDGSAREPSAVIAVNELTRRRTRRASVPVLTKGGLSRPVSFDFEETTVGALVVVDCWDGNELLGKAVVSLNDCRFGVPHTHFVSMLSGGRLVVQLLFEEA